MDKLLLTLLLSGLAFVTRSAALETTPPASPVVTFQLSGQVTSSSVTGGFGDLGMTNGSSWFGLWSYVFTTTDIAPENTEHGIFSPASPAVLLGESTPFLTLWINENQFSCYGGLWINTGVTSSTVSMQASFSEFSGGLTQTPWESTPSERNTSADNFSLNLSGLTTSAMAPDGLPYDMEFGGVPVGSLQLTGPLNFDDYNFDLSITSIELVPVPEPTACALLGLGALLLVAKGRRK